MKDDADLLFEFVEERSDGAFAELVRRHVDLVYSVALRELGGDSHAARDAAQGVFCELARQAGRLSGRRNLSGWLYQTARFVARRIRRTADRRQARETAFSMNVSNEVPPETEWKELEPVLNDAMQELSERDREAVILRYFREESLARVAHAIGSSENAARMRVERALEKLRRILERRGIRYSSGALAGALAVNSIAAAPQGLAASVTAVSLASVAAVASGFGSGTGLATSLMSAAKLKAGVVVILLGGTTTGLFLSERAKARLETRLAQAEQEVAALQIGAKPAQDSRVEIEPSELARLRDGNSELMRLRAEVTELRKAARVAGEQERRRAATAEAQTGEQKLGMERDAQLRTLGMEAKMSVAKAWGLAFQNFARANQGQMPRELDEAGPFFPELPGELKWMQSLAGGEFEITSRGELDRIENPAQAIILRERKPFNLQNDGAADRTYLFADGHTEIHHSSDGDFERWEQQHQPRFRAEQ